MTEQGEQEAYLRKYQAQLDQLNASLDEIKAKMRQAGAEAEIKYQEQLGELKAKRDALGAKLEEMRAAGKESWSLLRQGVERAAGELDAAWRAAKDRVG